VPSIAEAACDVLRTADPAAKAAASRAMAALWRTGGLTASFDCAPLDRPARPDRPCLLPPHKMPKRRKAGSVATRAALLHAIAHIEFNAIDLAWDIIVRFGHAFPVGFIEDWVRVADDEARHFRMLCGRLQQLGSHYGALPAHDGLWQAAEATKGDALARLVVVPMVLEARGLDVTPGMIARFEAAGDADSAAALRIILADEVSHVAAGRRWFAYICDQNCLDMQACFHKTVTAFYDGQVKGPFNTEARRRAGMLQDWYEPLWQQGA